jgi:hypothetical protein
MSCTTQGRDRTENRVRPAGTVTPQARSILSQIWYFKIRQGLKCYGVPRGEPVAAAGAVPLGRLRQLGLVAVVAVVVRQPLVLRGLGQALLLAPPALAPAPAPWPPAQLYTAS